MRGAFVILGLLECGVVTASEFCSDCQTLEADFVELFERFSREGRGRRDVTRWPK